MLGVNRYYRDVDKEIEVDPTTTLRRDRATTRSCSSASMQKPVLKALDYAIAARHETHRGGARLDRRRGDRRSSRSSGSSRTSRCRCAMLESPYRDISMPLIKYIKAQPRGARLRGRHRLHAAVHRRPLVGEPAAQPQGPAHPPQADARARRHRSRSCRGCSTRPTLIYGRRSRPLPGQDRRGEPRRPVMRKPLPPASVPILTPTKKANQASATSAAKKTNQADTATATKNPSVRK